MQTLSACFSATDDSDLCHFMVCHTLQNINSNATHAEEVYVIFLKMFLFLFFHRGKFRSSDGRLGNEFLFGGVLDEIR